MNMVFIRPTLCRKTSMRVNPYLSNSVDRNITRQNTIQSKQQIFWNWPNIIKMREKTRSVHTSICSTLPCEPNWRSHHCTHGLFQELLHAHRIVLPLPTMIGRALVG